MFVPDGEGGRKKVLENYIDVDVYIDMVCVDTKNFDEEDMWFMKCFVKILFFPIIFLLSILTAFLRFVLGILSLNIQLD